MLKVVPLCFIFAQHFSLQLSTLTSRNTYTDTLRIWVALIILLICLLMYNWAIWVAFGCLPVAWNTSSLFLSPLSTRWWIRACLSAWNMTYRLLESHLTTEFSSVTALAVCLIYRDLIVSLFVNMSVHLCSAHLCPSKLPPICSLCDTKMTLPEVALRWRVFVRDIILCTSCFSQERCLVG